MPLRYSPPRRRIVDGGTSRSHKRGPAFSMNSTSPRPLRTKWGFPMFGSEKRPKSLRGRLANRSRPGIEVLEFRVTPTTFHVNSLLDTVAVSLKTGKDASGQISLRSAIQAADAKPNADTIILPAGTITLTIAGPPEDNAASGDLDVRGNLTIKGKGAGETVIDGNNLDRVFQVLSGTVAISGVTIQHGLAAEGGGLLNSGGKVTLTSVSVVNNLAIGSSGAAGGNGVTAGSVGGDGSAGAPAAPPRGAVSPTRPDR